MNTKRNITILLKNPFILPLSIKNVIRSVNNIFDYNFGNGKSFNPKAITLYVTKICNLKCKMCQLVRSRINTIKLNALFRKEKNFLNLKMLKNFLSNWKGLKPYISLTGGETTLHPEIEKIIKTIKDYGFTCSMVTNGALLADKAQKIVSAGLDILVISLDGMQTVHDTIRGVPGTFQKAIEGIQEIIKTRNNKNLKKPLVFINTAVNNENINELEKLVNLAKDLNIDGINFQHIWMQNSSVIKKHNNKISDFKMHESYCLEIKPETINPKLFYQKLQNIKRRHPFVNIFPDLNESQINDYYKKPEKNILRKNCVCPWFFAVIQPDGRLTQCKEFEMGNLNQNTFSQIWNGEKYKNFRQRLKNQHYFPICARCCLYFRKY